MQMGGAAQSCFSLLPVSNATLVSAGDAAVEGGEAGFSPVSASKLFTRNILAYGMQTRLWGWGGELSLQPYLPECISVGN